MTRVGTKSGNLNRAKELVAQATGEPIEELTDETAVGQPETWDSIAHVHILLSLEEVIGRDLTTDETLECMDVVVIAQILDRA